MEKFKGKYRNGSIRLHSRDYSNPGDYFITICTLNRREYFGHIINNEMYLSETGKTAKSEWLKTPSLRPDMNLHLDAFVIMPDHFHAIIRIGRNKFNTDAIYDDRPAVDIHDKKDVYGICNGRLAMQHGEPTITNTEEKHNRFSPQRKNLASIICGFKSAVTTYTRKNNIEFAWQPRFYDRIIRNEEELLRTRNYIIQNFDKLP